MARNEDGEFELILGNRQLLSVFFIVVVLLGLCFLMGYVIGRNSAPPVNAENLPLPDDSSDVAVITPSETSAPETDRATPAQTAPQTAPEPADLPPPKPAPVTQTPAPEPPPAKQDAKSKLPPLPPVAGSTPSAGVYLQLSATVRAEAEAYVDRLRSKGFTATLAPVPGQDLFRVLVGPFPDSPAEIQRMRSRLNAATPPFPGNEAIPRRY